MTDRQKELGWCEEAQTYCSIAEDNYKKISAEAIDEFVSRIENSPNLYYGLDDAEINLRTVRDIAEQLKEKQNG